MVTVIQTNVIAIVGFAALLIALLYMLSFTRGMVSGMVGKIPVVGGLYEKLPTAF